MLNDKIWVSSQIFFFILLLFPYLLSLIMVISGLEPKCPPPALLLLLLWKTRKIFETHFGELASKPLNRLSSVTPFYKWEAMSFHHILSDLVSDYGKGPKKGFKNFFLNLFSELAKSLQPTLESSSIQTTEPIVKCYTILEMGSHDLSPHTFGSGLRFLKGVKK